jgi:hypothetical protein
MVGTLRAASAWSCYRTLHAASLPLTVTVIVIVIVFVFISKVTMNLREANADKIKLPTIGYS